MLPLGLSMLWESVEPEARSEAAIRIQQLPRSHPLGLGGTRADLGIDGPRMLANERSVTRTRSCGLRATAVGWW